MQVSCPELDSEPQPQTKQHYHRVMRGVYVGRFKLQKKLFPLLLGEGARRAGEVKIDKRKGKKNDTTRDQISSC